MSLLNRTKNTAGFSLIELALAMIVIGIMAASYFAYEKILREAEVRDNTTTALNTVSQAIKNFYFEYERYPCPADITLSEADPTYGEEICDPTVDFMTGGVPFKDLRIEPYRTLDGYQNKIIYSVSRTKTDTATFDDNEGFLKGLTVNETTGDLYSAGPHDEKGDFVIFSTGSNGVGGYTAGGSLIEACPDDTDVREAENCDGDETFIFTNFARNTRVGDAYYDDSLVFERDTPSQIWVQDDNGDDIKAQHLKIGIGTEEPEYDVDIVGNLKTDSGDLISPLICDNGSGTCFAPDKIGGTGMECGSGLAMTGIANGDAVCDVVFIPTTSVNCDTNNYVIGIDSNGNLICSP